MKISPSQNYILYFLFTALKTTLSKKIIFMIIYFVDYNQTDQRHNEFCVRIDINKHSEFDSK